MQTSSRGETSVDRIAPVLTCRCEEVSSEEIVAALAAGARTIDDVKRRTRAGMGLCQGIFCVPAIAAMVAQATESPIGRVVAMTARPPVRPIPLAALAEVNEIVVVSEEPTAFESHEGRT